MVTVDGSLSSLSCIVKAIVDSCSWGCADAWQWVGSIDLKLGQILVNYDQKNQNNLLLSQVISEVCDSVLAISDELLLSLLAVVFLAIDI